ncbi:MAG: helicase-related protein [Senegalimassilia faecalis]
MGGHGAAGPEQLTEHIVRAIIGDGQLHQAQRDILDNLAAGRSVLGVMVTGRGKSLTFQVHATLRALAAHEASLFVYPLRALIADQAFHLREALARFGITVVTLTGESTVDERRQAFAGLADGSVDIALTTPEFLAWHADSFRLSGRVRFVVVDEAHHVGLARAGQRDAYATIGQAVHKLGDPTVLALTATADDECAAAVRRELPIDVCVFDSADRPNLRLDDRRNVPSRDNYLANLVATGEKTVVFVNSREQSVAVARALRKHAPQVAPLIGFYNAGLSRSERKRIEQLFRTDALLVLIATSAFGEGVDIPNIRHVVLYHMPFNEIEFNQMSGRAGRDGKPACVHLLFSRNDCALNERILADMTPCHDSLAQVYRKLRDMQRASDTLFFTTSDAELAKNVSTDIFPVNTSSVTCAVAVFRELGLIEAHAMFGPDGLVRSIHVKDTQSKVQLTDSVRYREGLDEREIFHTFRDWVMRSNAADLQRRVSHPILPSDAQAKGAQHDEAK